MKEEEIDRILKNRMYNELRAPKKLKRREFKNTSTCFLQWRKWKKYT